MKRYKIDTDKISNLEDVKVVLKHMTLYFTPPPGEENGFEELKHLLVQDDELLIKVMGTRGAKFQEIKYAEQEEGDIQRGDWVVFKGIIQQVDAYFLQTIKDTTGIIKVKKPDWV